MSTSEPTAAARPWRTRLGRVAAGAVVGLVTVAGLGACSSAAPTKAERYREATTAALEIAALRSAGDNRAVWDLLVTQQQELLPIGTFEACVPPFPLDEPVSERDDLYTETIRIPGTRQTSESKRVVLRVPDRSDPAQAPLALSMVDQDGTWRWALDPHEIADCPIPNPDDQDDDESDEEPFSPDDAAPDS